MLKEAPFGISGRDRKIGKGVFSDLQIHIALICYYCSIANCLREIVEERFHFPRCFEMAFFRADRQTRLDMRLRADGGVHAMYKEVLWVEKVDIVGRDDSDPQMGSEIAQTADLLFILRTVVPHQLRKQMFVLPASGQIGE